MIICMKTPVCSVYVEFCIRYCKNIKIFQFVFRIAVYFCVRNGRENRRFGDRKRIINPKKT